MMEAVVDSANGDIRSAINTLQVVCINGDSLVQERGVKRKADGKSVKKRTKKMSKKVIAAVSGRESSLVLFHTLGKILYNKRVGDPDEEEESDTEEEKVKMKEEVELQENIPLPNHWQSFARRKCRVDVEVSSSVGVKANSSRDVCSF